MKLKRHRICTCTLRLQLFLSSVNICQNIFELSVITPSLSVSRILHLCWSDFYIASAGWFLPDGSLCSNSIDCRFVLVIILDQPWCLSCKGTIGWVPQIHILHAVFALINIPVCSIQIFTEVMYILQHLQVSALHREFSHYLFCVFSLACLFCQISVSLSLLTDICNQRLVLDVCHEQRQSGT